jgi:hypothetical protein
MAIEKTEPTCLPPEAYIRIIARCTNDQPPKFKSSYYPQKPKKQKK